MARQVRISTPTTGPAGRRGYLVAKFAIACGLALAACSNDGGPIGTEPAPSPTMAPTGAPPPPPSRTPVATGTPAPTAPPTPAFAACSSPDDADCCGNGIREGEESCDDANGSDADGCRADCTTACPDGLVDPNQGCATIGGGACEYGRAQVLFSINDGVMAQRCVGALKFQGELRDVQAHNFVCGGGFSVFHRCLPERD